MNLNSMMRHLVWPVVFALVAGSTCAAAPDSVQIFAAGATPTTLPCTFSFANNKLRYNLCPLLHRHKGITGEKTIEVDPRPIKIRIVEETPPTRTTSVYSIGLRSALDWNGTLPAELQCPKGTWICLIVENTRPSHPSEPKRRLQVIPVAGAPKLAPRAQLGKRRIPETNDTETIVQYLIHGGSYTDRPQMAYFQFICDASSKEPSEPTYLWRWNGTHTFEWKSRHACREASHVTTTAPGATEAPSPGGSDDAEDPIAEPPQVPDEVVEHIRPNPVLVLATVVGTILLVLRYGTKRSVFSSLFKSHHKSSRREIHHVEMEPLSPSQSYSMGQPPKESYGSFT
ncbi:hypothetical protein PTI98_000297 [Pleurotus ostreatus]|nr:hypothetical protein PTI98_000297 [Pleurotus ostreatus]